MLVLALVFLTVIGTMTAFLLSYAFTGTRSLGAYRLERTRRYAADSAMQATINRLTLPANATAGTGASMAQCGRYAIPQDVSAGNVQSVVAANAYVTVWCQATPGVPIDVIDLDGGQAPRDITMEVRCNTASGQSVVDKKLVCGAGGTAKVIGRARVRFENDYDNSVGADKFKRAVIPKVLSWQIRS